ncbi:hypothetical protein J6TS1_38080 [Siminovitchia terrae]|uniref:YcdB/YcdC repeated domain-containing protein n=1 Tax=Siminovitchia terrae TaxID=1914933 RepID=A0A429XA60_SIMTE|nr:YcdB/YcdC domain-containing protein [Siminovitchia terrae]RST60308.1 hypothetical protein D5F11_007635 [Siminovitchia terrae]GIN97938.1 hypothetical protein J6TS1_38080 [Siminovitchia terrae]
MDHLLMKLRAFVQRRKMEKLAAVPIEYEDDTYRLLFAESGEEAGEIVLDVNGRLKKFVEFDEKRLFVVKSKEELCRIVERFLEEIFPDSIQKLHLSSIVDVDDFYIFDYVQKDDKLGLSLPNSGVSFSISINGIILDMTNELGNVKAVYPEELLTEQDAMELYLKALKPQLKIMQYDQEMYIRGNNEFKLVYDFLNTAALDVKMDGALTNLEDLGMETYEYGSLPQLPIAETSIYRTVGAETMQKILTADSDQGKVEVWSHLPAGHLFSEYEDTDLLDLDIGIEHVIKMAFDCEDGKLNRMITVIDENRDRNRVSEAVAYEAALRILFNQFPEAHRVFKLRIEEAGLIEYEDEEITPFAFQFNFVRFENGIQVEGCEVSITICAATGELCEWCVWGEVNQDYKTLTGAETASVEEAMKLYESAFFMKLNWAKEEGEGDDPYYELVYLPEFQDSGGTIHCIDAETLEPWIVDSSSLEEFE